MIGHDVPTRRSIVSACGNGLPQKMPPVSVAGTRADALVTSAAPILGARRRRIGISNGIRPLRDIHLIHLRLQPAGLTPQVITRDE